MKVALIQEVFPHLDDRESLDAALAEARREGAELAVLPELPLQPWVPATRQVDDGDAEPPGGTRQLMLAAAARDSGIGLLGGAIVRDPASGKRTNRAFAFDARGELLASYDKLHVPQEEGFWEADHYDGGSEPPQAFNGFSLRAGMQICSDLFRPEGCHLLGAQGAGVVLAPRATDGSNYPRWRDVIRINAATSALFVVCVNRPRPEGQAAIGGPSVVAAPDGTLLCETADPVTVVTLEPALLARARHDYPGYLPVRADLYARGWRAVVEDS